MSDDQRPGLSRRSFLGGAARAGGAGLAVGGLGPLLAACHPTAPKAYPTPLGPNSTPTPRPLYPGNGRIEDGLSPEQRATLRIFTWPGKVSQRFLADFAKQFDCGVEVTTFATMSQAIRTLAKSPGGFDVFLGAPSNIIGPLVTRHLIQPLNRSYLPNIGNVWPSKFSSPYYDVHLRYSVPFTVYTTGIAWRKDLVNEDPYASSAGWYFPWQAKYRGKVAILDDYRESISLGLLATGTTDVNTPDPRLIDGSQQALLNLASLVKTRIDNDTANALATGRTAIHHAWSGQAVMAAAQLPSGLSPDVIGYWFPPDGVGPIGNDTGVIPRGARNPVLAHLLLNYLLDPVNAVTNMATSGFQQPLTELTPDRLVSAGVLPRSLVSAAILPTFYDNGLKELQLITPVDQLWQHAWNAVRRRG